MDNRIYLDHAATTPLDKAVLDKMLPYFTETFGNASSQHSFGRDALKAVDEARDFLAAELGAKASEIYFTSGGTEADNWAIRGVCRQYKKKGNHIIISAIEHAALMQTAKELERDGFLVSLLKVDKYGTVDLDELKRLLTPSTIFVGIMAANNEVGTIQPIAEAAKIVKQNNGAVFFTDAVQAAGAMPLKVKELGVDLLSISGHKFYGPKGIGVLYIKTGVKVGRLISGGHQERTRRGGTTNVPLIVGLASAYKAAISNLEQNNAHLKSLRDYFIDRVTREIPHSILNGHPVNRLPNNANFSFRYIEGESILFTLDLKGIAVSSGSACSSGSLEPSHVLLALGIEQGTAHGSIRFSFGKDNTKEEVDKVVAVLKETVKNLRELSPLYKSN